MFTKGMITTLFPFTTSWLRVWIGYRFNHSTSKNSHRGYSLSHSSSKNSYRQFYRRQIDLRSSGACKTKDNWFLLYYLIIFTKGKMITLNYFTASWLKVWIGYRLNHSTSKDSDWQFYWRKISWKSSGACKSEVTRFLSYYTGSSRRGWIFCISIILRTLNKVISWR